LVVGCGSAGVRFSGVGFEEEGNVDGVGQFG
jgi:hypothetical protein